MPNLKSFVHRCIKVFTAKSLGNNTVPAILLHKAVIKRAFENLIVSITLRVALYETDKGVISNCLFD